jgi:hypothetical protein
MSEGFPADKEAANDAFYEAFMAEHFPEDEAGQYEYASKKAEEILSGERTLVVRNHEADLGFVLDCYDKAQLAAFIDVDENGVAEVFLADQLSPPAFVDTFDSSSKKQNIIGALATLGFKPD